ncbi:unnamed protein product [Adineta steineri]|uniref:Uncharacterized protein n=1 Tax=Adineta steineri TaxID=433720 RepID=A0A813W095_9BILA|nr:unnamed protein product [Adineta steineri]CAF3879833.1 unnamed protein product [Adineta steineri]
MAENGHHPQIRRHSTRKVRSPAAALLMQPRKSLSSPSSPINKGNLTGNSSRSRHLWNLAVESVLENEKEVPKSTSMNSSTVANEPIGWYNLTKRMTSSMSSIIQYHLLDNDINKSEIIKQDHDIENDEYFSFSSSSTPTISLINDLTDESNR